MGSPSNKNQKAYRGFLQAKTDLLDASGLPISIYESRRLFDDFLMHAYSARRHFSVDVLSVEQREALVKVAVRYLQAGFADPGICAAICDHEEILRRARQDL